MRFHPASTLFRHLLQCSRLRAELAEHMKQIFAVVKPFRAEKLIAAVAQLDVEEISIREVKGFGRQKNYLDRYGENEYSLAFIPKVEISVWVEDANMEAVIELMTRIARTGRLGDGKIFVMPVCETLALNRSPNADLVK